MKCYRCGEDNPEPTPSRAELAAALQQAHVDLVKAREEAEDLRATLNDDEEVKEAWRQVEELKGELRRYEPSDGMMYTLLEKRTVINEAAELFERAQKEDAECAIGVHDATWEAVGAWLERHRNSWNNDPRPIPEPEATIRALHTVIDEGRQLFDRAWQDDNETCLQMGYTSTIAPDTWAAIDEWRQRVLVARARETVSGEVAKMMAVIDNCDEIDARRVARIKELEKLAADRAEMIQGLENERTVMIDACKRLAERKYTCTKCGVLDTDWYRVAYAGIVDANVRLAAENARLRLQLGIQHDIDELQGKGTANDENDGDQHAGAGGQAGAFGQAPDEPGDAR